MITIRNFAVHLGIQSEQNGEATITDLMFYDKLSDVKITAEPRSSEKSRRHEYQQIGPPDAMEASHCHCAHKQRSSTIALDDTTSEPPDLKGMTLMNTPADRELNKRLIDISKALTTLLCGTSTVDDSAYIRDEALRAVAEQSELARLKLSRAASGK